MGVDEVGRGALAGPVVAAALSLHPKLLTNSWKSWLVEQANDSKKLKPSDREKIVAEIKALKSDGLIYVELGEASVAEIEQHNIVGATCLAMNRALSTLAQNHSPQLSFNQEEMLLPIEDSSEAGKDKTKTRNALVLVDGRPMKRLNYPHEGVVQGDGQSLSIALASIYAKVARDKMMVAFDEIHPNYGFAQHKGYGTLLHRRSIDTYGPLPLHRPRFLSKVVGKEKTHTSC